MGRRSTIDTIAAQYTWALCDTGDTSLTPPYSERTCARRCVLSRRANYTASAISKLEFPFSSTRPSRWQRSSVSCRPFPSLFAATSGGRESSGLVGRLRLGSPQPGSVRLTRHCGRTRLAGGLPCWRYTLTCPLFSCKKANTCCTFGFSMGIVALFGRQYSSLVGPGLYSWRLPASPSRH